MAWITPALALLWYLLLALSAGIVPAELDVEPEPPPIVAVDCPDLGYPAENFRTRLAEVHSKRDFSSVRDMETVQALFLNTLTFTQGCDLIGAEAIDFLYEPRTMAETRVAVASMADALGIQVPRVSTNFDRCPAHGLACAIREGGNTTLVFNPEELLIFPILHEFAHHADWEILGKPPSMHSHTWVDVLAWMLDLLGLYDPVSQCGWVVEAGLGLNVCEGVVYDPIK